MGNIKGKITIALTHLKPRIKGKKLNALIFPFFEPFIDIVHDT